MPSGDHVCQTAFSLHNDEPELIDFAFRGISKAICSGNCDFRINRETSFPVPPMSRGNSGGNYPRKGQVRRTVGTIKRVRALCGVDLANIITMESGKTPNVGLLERLAADPVLLVDVLFAVCKPEADAKGITDEEFGRAMAGDAIELAATALLDEIIDFFPEAKRKVFRKILDASRRFEARSKQALTELLEDPAFDEKIDQALDRLTISSSVSPESPESIPTP